MSEVSASAGNFDIRQVRSRASVAGPEPLMIISSDSHASAAPHDYVSYLDPQYRQYGKDYLDDIDWYQRITGRFGYPIENQRLDFFDDRGALRSGGEMAYFDPYRHLREATGEGIVAEVLHPTGPLSSVPFSVLTCRNYSPELRAAGVRAYNRWLHDYASVEPDRLIQVWLTYPYPDVRAAAQMCVAARNAGAKAVEPGLQAGAPGDPCPPLFDPSWDPFWAACQDLGLVINLHVGIGHLQGRYLEIGKQLLTPEGEQRWLKIKAEAGPRASAEAFNAAFLAEFGPSGRIERRPWIHMMLGGVFDRFPRLKVALHEIHADWIPATLTMLDEAYARGDTLMKHSPSEYWVENCWVGGAIMRFTDIAAREPLGVPKLMFATDFPHQEGSWPNTRDWIRVLFRGISEPDARRILGENALELYGLDEQLLRKLSRVHGPSPDEVLGDHPVPDELVDEFDLRHGLRKSPEIHEDWTRLTIENARIGAAQASTP